LDIIGDQLLGRDPEIRYRARLHQIGIAAYRLRLRASARRAAPP
jgi:hypothetical protein